MSAGSLWEALDAALIAAFDAGMGEDSSYEELQIVAAEVGDTWEPDASAKPALLLISNAATLSQTTHGAGAPIDAALAYMAVAYAEAGTHSEAKIAAQTLHARMLDVLRTWPAIVAAAHAEAPSGQAYRMRLQRSLLEVRGRQGANRGRRLGIAVIRFDIDTTT